VEVEEDSKSDDDDDDDDDDYDKRTSQTVLASTVSGPDLGEGPGPQASHQKGASHQTLVTNCSAENRLRTSMTQERLVNLAIMSIESDILHEIDFTTIITDFAAAKSRKVSGLWL